MNRRDFIKISAGALSAAAIAKLAPAVVSYSATYRDLGVEPGTIFRRERSKQATIADLEATLKYIWDNWEARPEQIWVCGDEAQRILGLSDVEWRVFCKRSAGRARYERRYRRSRRSA